MLDLPWKAPVAVRLRNVGARSYRGLMDPSPVVSMEALWPELAEQRRPFEVVVTVPRSDGGEPLVPCSLPAEVIGCWSADQVVMSVTVLAPRPSGALAAAEVLVPDLARAAGAVMTVRPAAVPGVLPA